MPAFRRVPDRFGTGRRRAIAGARRIGAILLALLLATAGTAPLRAVPPNAAATLGPDLAKAMERHFPDELPALTEALDREVADRPGDREALGLARSRLLARFYKSKLGDLVNAPAPVLNALNMRQLGLARDLARTDLPLCARYASTGFIGAPDLPPAYQPRASALAAAMVDTSKAGAGRARDPNREALTAEDAGAWYARLIEVEPSADVQAVVAAGDSAGKVESDEMKCKVAIALYASIAALPSDQAANVGAFFLAQSIADLLGE